MSQRIISLVALLISTTAMSQSGYFGSVNAIEVRTNLIPTRFRSTSLEVNPGDADVVSRRLRVLQPAFQVNYLRVMNRRIELSAGYGYTPLRTHSITARVENDMFGTQRVIEDARGAKHDLELGVRFYRKGSKAPVGKFIGFSITGMAGSLNSEFIQSGEIQGETEESSFINVKNVVGTNQFEDELTNGSFAGFGIRLTGGRTFPLTDHLQLSTFVSAPLLHYFRTPNSARYGFAINSTVSITDGDASSLMILTARRYTRLYGSIGVRYQF